MLDAIERRRTARRHPVIPETIATRDAARALAGDLVGHMWFLARFHGFRLPAYVFWLVWRAPVGLYRLARVITEAIVPSEARPLRAAAVRERAAGDDVHPV